MSQGVSVEGISKRFGKTQALDCVSLDVEPGELFFLLGPSGCGKTTLLRSIAGFCMPDAGAIRVGSVDVTQVAAHNRDMGMVFQNYALWPHMSLRNNIAFGLETRRLSRAEIARRVDEVLEQVQMLDRADAMPNELSGGQQQRVALARALVIRPSCLLLDEPLSNLDAKLRLEMRAEIRRICKAAGVTGIYVTHDQKEALSMADRLAVMDRGRLCQLGTPRQVYRRPASRFVASFIGETNLLEGQVRSVAQGTGLVSTVAGSLKSSVVPCEVVEGTAVHVSIRPEAFTLRRNANGKVSGSSLRGVCESLVYLGELAQYRVRLGDGCLLNVAELNPGDGGVGEGQHVELSVAPEDVVLLEKERG